VSWSLHKGDALAVLRDLPTGSVDAVITDPPYSSGGMMRSDRTNVSAAVKYVQSGAQAVGGDFTGDNRDQRSFAYWETLWMSEARRVTKPGGVIAAFTDWRQLPSTTDAVQAAGWVWRGLAVWAKPTARPMRGGFRNSCEYIAWGTNGPVRKDHEVYLPGHIVTPSVRGTEKAHITQKPVALMEVICGLVAPGETILDPFTGSGSTGVAALNTGRQFIGVETMDSHHAVATARLTAAAEAQAGGRVA
jgi:site-specific DNA-methyltransferase (adenine-specific)